jgi:DNA-binding CsgD family transcriptional regulator
MIGQTRGAMKAMRRDIVLLLIDGKTIKEAARELGLTGRQASSQLEQARIAMGKRTTLELAIAIDRERR